MALSSATFWFIRNADAQSSAGESDPFAKLAQIANGTETRDLPCEIVVGDRKITLVPPDGFSFVTGAYLATVRALIQVPDENQLLAACLTSDDLKSIQEGKLPKLAKYGLLESAKKVETKDVSEREFANFSNLFLARSNLRSNNSDIFKSRLKKAAFLTPSYRLSGGYSLEETELLFKGPKFASIWGFYGDKSDRNSLKAYSMTAIALKNRLVFLYMYFPYNQDDRGNDLEDSVAQCIERTLSAN